MARCVRRFSIEYLLHLSRNLHSLDVSVADCYMAIKMSEKLLILAKVQQVFNVHTPQLHPCSHKPERFKNVSDAFVTLSYVQYFHQ